MIACAAAVVDIAAAIGSAAGSRAVDERHFPNAQPRRLRPTRRRRLLGRRNRALPCLSPHRAGAGELHVIP